MMQVTKSTYKSFLQHILGLFGIVHDPKAHVVHTAVIQLIELIIRLPVALTATVNQLAMYMYSLNLQTKTVLVLMTR